MNNNGLTLIMQKNKDIILQENFVPQELDNNFIFRNPQNKKIDIAYFKSASSVRILTEEIKPNKYNKFESPFDNKNELQLRIDHDIGIQSLIENVLTPIDDLMIKQNIKQKIAGAHPTKYWPIVGNKKNLKFKLYNASIYISNHFGEMIEKNITGDNIQEISQYLTPDSRLKFILNINKIWRSKKNDNGYEYGVFVVCEDILIINGVVPDSNISKILQKYQNSIEKKNDEENEITIEL